MACSRPLDFAADDLARALCLSPDSIIEVADLYHAVEHLTDITELCAA